MFRNYRVKRVFSLVMLVAAVLLAIGCAGTTVRKATNELDTPEHHVFTGLKLIDQQKYADAQREFELALGLNDKYSKAYYGMGLAKAYQADYTSALEQLDTAWKYAETNDEKLAVHIGYIRVNTLSKAACVKIGVDCEQDKSWLDKCWQSFKAAEKLDPKSAAANYFMGLAYKTALQFSNASAMFARVLELKGDYVREADAQWDLVQKIQRAMPGTVTGKKIALVESITRADAAALFMEELKIDVLYKKRTPKTFDTSFKDPEKAAQTAVKGQATARDIADHPLRADIEGILEIGVRGLENDPQSNFHPEKVLARAEYAMMLEDILVKVTGDNGLSTKFIGSKSLFPDLREDLPYFNAVMVVTSRGIMSADMASGEFAPLKPVDGVDALLIIRKVKEELKFN
jgi:tetratricopeptide (TPR) repeat protein